MSDVHDSESLADQMFGPEPEPLTEEPAQAETEAPPPADAGEAASSESEAPVQPNPAPPASDDAVVGRVAAVMAERAERQKAQAEAAELRKQLAELQRKPATIPDSIEDPEGYNAYHAEQIAAAEWRAIGRMSRAQAIRTHGVDLVTKASEWWDSYIETNPAERAAIQRQDDPFEYAIAKYQRQTDLDRLQGKTLDALIEEEVAKRMAAGGVTSAPPAQPAPRMPVNNLPPRSIVDKGSSPPQPGSAASAKAQADSRQFFGPGA